MRDSTRAIIEEHRKGLQSELDGILVEREKVLALAEGYDIHARRLTREIADMDDDLGTPPIRILAANTVWNRTTITELPQATDV